MKIYDHIQEEEQGRRQDQREFCNDMTMGAVIIFLISIMIITLIHIW